MASPELRVTVRHGIGNHITLSFNMPKYNDAFRLILEFPSLKPAKQSMASYNNTCEFDNVAIIVDNFTN